MVWHPTPRLGKGVPMMDDDKDEDDKDKDNEDDNNKGKPRRSPPLTQQ